MGVVIWKDDNYFSSSSSNLFHVREERKGFEHSSKKFKVS